MPTAIDTRTYRIAAHAGRPAVWWLGGRVAVKTAGMMSTSTDEEFRFGGLAVRFPVEGGASGGSVAVFAFDVPAEAKVAADLKTGREGIEFGSLIPTPAHWG